MENLHATRMKGLAESEERAAEFGLNVRYLHLSALSPTTRKSHADRHGRLFTAQQVREFWSDPANLDGCRCSVTQIMVDDDGNPIVPSIVARAKATYEKMKARGYDWSK